MVIAEVEQGINKHTLNLDDLLNGDIVHFEKKWREFYKSDKLNPKIFFKRNRQLSYLCDHHVPQKTDNRYPLFLLFGNSTPHSIDGKLYFSYEGNGREHRMWKLLKKLNVLDFRLSDSLTLPEKNKYRKEAIFNLSYDSAFRVAMDVYVSIPSTPSKPPWSGVAGVQKLLGAKAFRKLLQLEKERLAKRISEFTGDNGAIIAFQKDAYNGVVAESSQKYGLDDAINGGLSGHCLFNEKITVYGVAPTRWLNGGRAKETLENLVTQLKSDTH